MRPVAEFNAALIIPALNEEPVIAHTLGRVPPRLFRTIIVADNGSSDATARVARQAGALVISQPERGYGAACLAAIASLPEDTDAVVFMQADSSEDPAEAENLLYPLQIGRADLVIGSRTLGHPEKGSLLAHQRFGNLVATVLIRLFYRHRFTDLGPFRAITFKALKQLNMRDRNYGWTVEMQVRALQHKLRVEEVPVRYAIRAAGENKVSGNVRASLQAGYKILSTIIRLTVSRS